MDVLWFRLSRRDERSDGADGPLLPRRAAGADRSRRLLAVRSGHPEGRARARPRTRAAGVSRPDRPAGSVRRATGWTSCATGRTIKLLSVQVDRLCRWFRPGLLCIGDAAHAMSPVGGVGINLAIQDAVAAARFLATPLRRGPAHRRRSSAGAAAPRAADPHHPAAPARCSESRHRARPERHRRALAAAGAAAAGDHTPAPPHPRPPDRPRHPSRARRAGRSDVPAETMARCTSSRIPRCRNGPAPGVTGGVAVPRVMVLNNGVRVDRPQASAEDSRGAFCRD